MNNQAVKQDADKPHVEWVPPAVVWAMAAVRGYGVAKYGDPDNYKRVETVRLLAAAYRHLLRVLEDPEARDAESGLPHLWHCLCNIGLAVAQTYKGQPGRGTPSEGLESTSCVPARKVDD